MRTAAGALGPAVVLCFNPKTKEHQIWGFFTFHRWWRYQQGSGFNPRPVAGFSDNWEML